MDHPPPEKLTYLPSIEQEEEDEITRGNKAEQEIVAYKVTLDGTNYAWEKSTGNVYDYKSYQAKNPIKIGTLEIQGKKYNFKKLV